MLTASSCASNLVEWQSPFPLNFVLTTISSRMLASWAAFVEKYRDIAVPMVLAEMTCDSHIYVDSKYIFFTVLEY